MASNRDRLRAMSKKNLESQKQLANQPTLVTDVINQLNDTSIEVEPKAEPVVEAIENKSELTEEEPVTNHSEAQPEQEVLSELESTPNVEQEPEVTPENEPTTNKSEDVEEVEPISLEETNLTDQEPVKKEKTTPKKSKKTKTKEPAISNTKTYTGREVTVTLLLSEEVEQFLTYKAIELRIPAKRFFKDLMVNEIENGVLVEDALSKAYRKTQHDTVKKSIPVNEDLKEAIKETAIKYHMKYTPFMAYVIDKARLADSSK